ncbi:MAG: glycosyltransferase family 4 protein [Planctomycetota bacterium]|nr:glycosyltransferase family 4 protein [Planctomycetota bacterium]MCZ6850200.1 glycosyltransferase family 4 protein [Planctomycetota bacterium]
MSVTSRKKRPALRRIAFIGNSLPRQCGIATFTGDLSDALARTFRQAEVFVVPVNDIKEGYDYPDRVWFEITEKDVASYRRAADFLNINNVDVVNLQHEFGIFGGPAGSHILILLRELRMPTVITLHTILHEPEPTQRAVMEELAELSDGLVVMTNRSAELLREVYGIEEHKIEIIPHGIPDVPFVDPSFYKDKFGVEGKNVLLTFGLLGPSKGIECVIEALPAIIDRHPDTVYIILGATHPTLKRHQGEIYRLSLQQLARECGVESRVIFHNRFVSAEELTEFLGAADLYVTPYLNTAQAVSGTLAFAVGAGKAIVSTPYWHAEELLAEERGVLAPIGDSDAVAEAVIGLLDDPVRRDAMRKRAYLFGRDMIWPKVARRYMEAFDHARDMRLHRPRPAFEATTLDKRPGELPLLKLDHLRRMTDGTGLLQHATFGVPNYSEGYCTDDNARALIFSVLVDEAADVSSEELSGFASRYMAFIQHAFHPRTKRFRNFLSHDRRWLEEEGSEDSHGRAMWALGTVVAHRQQQGIREWAGQLFEAALPPTLQFKNPRAWAFTLLGIHEYLTRYSGDRIAQDAQRVLGERLLDMYQPGSDSDWLWFENLLTYCNAKLPHALLVCGRSMSRDDMVETALESLEWLAQIQRADGGHFVPIGSNGFYSRGGERARFDQQPIEAHATVAACLEAHRATGDDQWKVEAQRAFDWFVGRNDLRTPIYDPSTGGCHDGLQPDHVNPNLGAESMLAFLLSLVEMRLAEAAIEIPAAQVLATSGT